MDTRSDKWYAELALSGTAKPQMIQGSILHILGVVMATLKTQRPRQLTNGAEINLLIRDRPISIDGNKHESIVRKVQEIEAGLDDSLMTRNPKIAEGETYEEYLQFLLDSGMTFTSADYMARAWYGLEPDQELATWMSDPKADRFRILNTIASEYARALPSEYELLKTYVKETYPRFVEHIIFRTA